MLMIIYHGVIRLSINTKVLNALSLNREFNDIQALIN